MMNLTFYIFCDKCPKGFYIGLTGMKTLKFLISFSKQLVVVISNGVTTYRMSDVTVTVKPDNADAALKDSTDYEGAAFFSFEGASKFEIVIDQAGFDPVTKNALFLLRRHEEVF